MELSINFLEKLPARGQAAEQAISPTSVPYPSTLESGGT